LATNIIARGIDIRDVCFVINCDAPREKASKGEDGVISIDTYLHRVGRTGRYSDKGIALTIVPAEKDKKYLI
jgi:superfamily II DNA/RNA helicase